MSGCGHNADAMRSNFAGGKEAAHGGSRHMRDLLFAWRSGGVEDRRLEQGRLAGVDELRGGEFRIADARFACCDLRSEIAR